MSNSVAMGCSGSNQTTAHLFQDLSMFNGRADLMGLAWTPVAGFLEYEPTLIEQELVGMVIEDLCGLLVSLTRDNTVGERVREQNMNNVTFQSFVRDLFEPDLLKEVGTRFEEAQGQPENFVEERQLKFQQEMVKSVNEWMRDQQKAFRQQALSMHMLMGRVAALE